MMVKWQGFISLFLVGMIWCGDGILDNYQSLTINDNNKAVVLSQFQTTGDFNNVVVVESLLNQILNQKGSLYPDLIGQALATKQTELLKYLQAPSGLVSQAGLSSEVKIDPVVQLPDLAGSQDIVDSDLIRELQESTGVGIHSIKARLLNNLVILEYLLFLLGQDYSESIKTNLLDKQQVLEKIEVTAILKTLLEHGYSLDLF
jgi:hypothetical protein